MSSSPPVPHPRRWTALAVLALVQFMLVLDDTIVNIALPSVQADLGLSDTGLAWVVNAYVIAFAGLLLLGGRIADLAGRRRVFAIGLSVFAVASLTSGLAQSEAMLIGSRVLQGVGGALVAPAALSLVMVLFTDPAERAKAVGIWGGLAALGGTLGVVLSGLITDLASWRWIFLINLPVAAFALIAVPRLVHESRAGHGTRVDVAGAVTLTGGLTALVYGLIEAGDAGWGSTVSLAALAAALVLLGAFVAVEARTAEPLVPLSFFRHRARAGAAGGLVLVAAAFFGLFFLLTLYMQRVLGYSPLNAGLAYLAFGGGLMLGIATATQLLPRIGVRPVVLAGPLLSAAGLLWLSRAPVDGTYVADLLGPMLLVSFGNAWAFVPLQVAGTTAVDPDQTGLASALLGVAPQIGGALGIAIVVALATDHAQSQLAAGAAPLAAQVAGFQLALTVAAALMTCAGVLAAALAGHIRPTPEQLRPGAEPVLPEAAAVSA